MGWRRVLSDDISALENRNHRALPNSGGLLEAVLVDAAEQVVFDSHLCEARYYLDLLRGLELQRLLWRLDPPWVLADHACAAEV